MKLTLKNFTLAGIDYTLSQGKPVTLAHLRKFAEQWEQLPNKVLGPPSSFPPSLEDNYRFFNLFLNTLSDNTATTLCKGPLFLNDDQSYVYLMAVNWVSEADKRKLTPILQANEQFFATVVNSFDYQHPIKTPLIFVNTENFTPYYLGQIIAYYRLFKEQKITPHNLQKFLSFFFSQPGKCTPPFTKYAHNQAMFDDETNQLTSLGKSYFNADSFEEVLQNLYPILPNPERFIALWHIYSPLIIKICGTTHHLPEELHVEFTPVPVAREQTEESQPLLPPFSEIIRNIGIHGRKRAGTRPEETPPPAKLSRTV